MSTSEHSPQVAIIMGSDSDWPTLRPAAEACEHFGIATEVRVVSAHRTPVEMMRYAQEAHTRGIRVIIAGAGGAAHLPGMVASLTPLPVIGVPVQLKTLDGLDSLLSIVQMPGGVPVATMAINGGKNAGLYAARILAASDSELLEKILAYQKTLAEESAEKNHRLQTGLE